MASSRPLNPVVEVGKRMEGRHLTAVGGREESRRRDVDGGGAEAGRDRAFVLYV